MIKSCKFLVKTEIFLPSLSILVFCFSINFAFNFDKLEFVITNVVTICIFIFSLVKQNEIFEKTLEKQNEAIKEQKILGAWQILATKAIGNSGKRKGSFGWN